MKLANLFKVKLSATSFILISILPSLLYVTLKLPSLTLGFILSVVLCLMLIITSEERKLNINNIRMIISIILMVVLMGAVSPYGQSFKLLGGCIILTSMMTLAAYTSNHFKRLSDVEFKSFFMSLSRVIVFLGITSFFLKINILNYNNFVKSIFTFYEPSHYATVLGVILISYLLMAERFERWVVITLVIALALYTPSVTLLVYLFIYLVISVQKVIYFFGAIALLLIISIAVNTLNPELTSYILSRVILSPDSDNLSALIYIQGWAEAYKVIQESYLTGLGFQMSGSNSPSEIAEKVYQISGIYKNRDGPFIASKLIVDFGLLGILLISMYLFTLAKFYFSFFTASGSKNKFIYGTFFAFSVEMFVRSNAYFTFGTFVLFISIFLIIELRFSNINGKEK